MQTRSFKRFKDKIQYYDDDIELIDIVRISVLNGELSSSKSPRILNNLDPEIHTHLRRRSNSDGGRELIVNHLRATLYSSYVRDIYSEVAIYLRDILRRAAKNRFDPGRLIGEHKITMDAQEILSYESWEELSGEVTSRVFQMLEAERSTIQLLRKMSKKLGLGVDESIIAQAIPFLEIRHALVHNEGILTSDFIKNNRHIRVKAKRRIDLTIQFIGDFREAVRNLIMEFDSKIISSEILDVEYCS